MSAKVCAVCLYCEKFNNCLKNESLRYCSDDNFASVNSTLDKDVWCHNPPECGADLCMIATST